MRAVINRCAGGFRLSQEALKEIQKKDSSLVIEVGDELELANKYVLETRSNPIILQVIEELGLEKSANELVSELKIVEYPDDVEVILGAEDRGYEWIEEIHRTWY